MFIRRYIRMLLSLCLLTGCSFRPLHETLHVVGEADSLWHQGQMYDDSTQLARTYSALHAWRAFYADEYAHACYHYGKLLRAKEDPVSAMQAFINATHSRTRDYHILGRVYSNMGDICHLAGDYSMAYDMFEQSANSFLYASDTILYYYLLNDMAFELAEQGLGVETQKLLCKITKESKDNGVVSKTFETKILLAFKAEEYDSIISYVNSLSSPQYMTATLLIAKSQAFYFLHEYDSAYYYAKQTLDISHSLYDYDNAYYILMRCDSVCSGNEVYTLSSNRADIEKEIEIRHGKLSQAVQLLEQDLHRKLDLKWLYAILATIFIIGIVMYYYRRYLHRRHSLLSQKVEALSAAYSDIQSNKIGNIEHVSEMLRTSSEFARELCWRDFNKMCVIADNHFYLLTTKLKQKQVLNEQEIRLCILIVIDYNNIQIANILSYAVSGVGKFKYRVAQKLGTDTKSLRKYLLYMAIDETFQP